MKGKNYGGVTFNGENLPMIVEQAKVAINNGGGVKIDEMYLMFNVDSKESTKISLKIPLSDQKCCLSRKLSHWEKMESRNLLMNLYKPLIGGMPLPTVSSTTLNSAEKTKMLLRFGSDEIWMLWNRKFSNKIKERPSFITQRSFQFQQLTILNRPTLNLWSRATAKKRIGTILTIKTLLLLLCNLEAWPTSPLYRQKGKVRPKRFWRWRKKSHNQSDRWSCSKRTKSKTPKMSNSSQLSTNLERRRRFWRADPRIFRKKSMRPKG